MRRAGITSDCAGRSGAARAPLGGRSRGPRVAYTAFSEDAGTGRIGAMRAATQPQELVSHRSGTRAVLISGVPNSTDIAHI